GATASTGKSLERVEVNRLYAGRHHANSRVDIATLQLKALVGMPPAAPLVVRGDLVPSSLPLDPSEAMQRAVSDRADIAVARAEAATASAMVKKEQAEARWDASINVGYQRQDFGFNLNGVTSSGATRPIQDVFHYFGGGISVMLPVRNRNEGNI